MLTIVMYHFVRETAATPFPGIHARTPQELDAQLDHVARTYEVVRLADVIRHYRAEQSLPAAACLLTFDDGLIDHRDAALPALAARGLSGCFCPAAQSVLERRVLDVQKVQFLVAACEDRHALQAQLFERLAALRTRYSIPTDEALRLSYEHAGRFDPGETVLVKRLLQDGLPEGPRRIVLDELFRANVTDDEREFADALYLSLDDLRAMGHEGMDLAGHGLSHIRLGGLAEADQRREITASRALLENLRGQDRGGWTMCYPYGSRDGTTLSILAQEGCTLGLTTDVAICGDSSSPLELPRIDTNDLPTTDPADSLRA